MRWCNTHQGCRQTLDANVWCASSDMPAIHGVVDRSIRYEISSGFKPIRQIAAPRCKSHSSSGKPRWLCHWSNTLRLMRIAPRNRRSPPLPVLRAAGGCVQASARASPGRHDLTSTRKRWRPLTRDSDSDVVSVESLFSGSPPGSSGGMIGGGSSPPVGPGPPSPDAPPT